MVLLNLGCSFFGLIFSVPELWNLLIGMIHLLFRHFGTVGSSPKHVLLPLCVQPYAFSRLSTLQCQL